ncbi:MAG: hypothetical protein R3B54_17955 [Bdellovibrionota bacterium]
MRELVRGECREVFLPPWNAAVGDPKPLVISIVGVNGVGKTTTIGKLASRLTKEGKSVLLGAADTFRAGAIFQLRRAERSGSRRGWPRGEDQGAVARCACGVWPSRWM